jgi:hypothetical protein
VSDELEADGADYYEHERLCRLHDEEERECALRAKVEQLERENAALREVLVDIARPRPNHTAEHMQLKAQAAIDAIRAINALRAKEGAAP